MDGISVELFEASIQSLRFLVPDERNRLQTWLNHLFNQHHAGYPEIRILNGRVIDIGFEPGGWMVSFLIDFNRLVSYLDTTKDQSKTRHYFNGPLYEAGSDHEIERIFREIFPSGAPQD